MRLLWILPAARTTFQGDEQGYVEFASAWIRTGTYDGHWPPLQALFLRPFVEYFAPGAAILLARIATAFLSVATGAWIMVAARSIAGDRSARLSGWIWALYLPLMPFAHVLGSDGLFMALLLPAIAILLRDCSATGGQGGAQRAFIVAGGLLGLACLTREAGLFWLAALAVWTWRRAGRHPALVTSLAAAVVIGCWSIPNSIRAGAVVPLGKTAGLNAYMGWNAHYVNFDLQGVKVPTQGVPGASLRASLLRPPGGLTPWAYDFTGDYLERDRRALRSGVNFVLEQPAFIARTRIVKAADVFTPLSELVRHFHQARPRAAPEFVGHLGDRTSRTSSYGWVLSEPRTRTALAGLATLLTVLLFLLAIPGVWLFRSRTRSGAYASSLFIAGWAATAGTSAVVAMTRLRAPFEALLIIPAAITVIALVDRQRPSASRLRWSAAVASVAILGFLWHLSLPAVVGVFQRLFGNH